MTTPRPRPPKAPSPPRPRPLAEGEARQEAPVHLMLGGEQASTANGADPGAGWPSGPGLDGEERPPEEEERPRSWRPVDLGPVLDGTWRRPAPTVGRRDDGAGLFYPGRVHLVASEAEAGKTWFALAAVATELRLGHSCVYLDFEDDEGGTVGRLLTLGAAPADIRRLFAYIRPDEPLGLRGRADLAEVLADLKPSLIILDGVTEAMTMHGLDLRDNTAVATFGRVLLRWLADLGPAVVALDHVVKDRERQGGHAIGGVHKLNGLNGAMYLLENRAPFGVGITGRSRVMIRKDRPGELRRRGVPGREGLFWYADLVITSHGEDFAEVTLPAAVARAEDAQFEPTVIMGRVASRLAAEPGGLSKSAIVSAVTGKTNIIRLAVELLISRGYVTAEAQGRGKADICKLTRPYPDHPDPTPTHPDPGSDLY